MKHATLSPSRAKSILAAAARTRAIVIGDVMLDQFIWGQVGRISPEAPVPVVDFDRESFIPGGAGNVARNLAQLRAQTELLGVSGEDEGAARLKELLTREGVGCSGIIACAGRLTSVKTRSWGFHTETGWCWWRKYDKGVCICEDGSPDESMRPK